MSVHPENDPGVNCVAIGADVTVNPPFFNAAPNLFTPVLISVFLEFSQSKSTPHQSTPVEVRKSVNP